MADDSKEHSRRSVRLKGYDYSQAGAYYVTICTQGHTCLFGAIIDGHMVLNNAGMMVERWYAELQMKYPDVTTDKFIVMPNHFHAIIITVGADLRVCPDVGERT
jgi:REP element-mobilizing transposase RayT